MSSITTGLKRLPLFYKLLIPFLTLILVVGSFGAFLIVRDLSSRTQATLDQSLTQSSVNARAVLHDRELYLLESANFAANLRGMTQAISSNDSSRVAILLESVLALKSDLNLLAVTNPGGGSVVEFFRNAPGESPQRGGGTSWSTHPFVEQALRNSEGGKSAGFLELSGKSVLVIAGPICAEPSACQPAGAAIVGISLDRVVNEAAGTIGPNSAVDGLAIYDVSGHVLSSAGRTSPKAPTSRVEGASTIRRNEKVGGAEFTSLYAPLEIQGRREGTVAVTVNRGEAFSSIKDAAAKLVIILLGAMAGIVAIGALISKFILAQVRPLLQTNRNLGAGDLTARAPVVTEDELGELARGVNQMAEQLEASYETLESRVTQRTEEVQRLLKERTELFAGISHEFRTPLAVIISQAELMLDPTYPKRGRWSYEIGEIRDSAQQLLFLINDILDLARAESGRIGINLDDVAIPSVIDGLKSTATGLASAGDLELSFDVPSKMPAVRADAFRLREVILNLVDNAAKYTPPGGRVELRAVASEESVEVSVTDDGVGIPKEARERIFDPFYRVPGTEAQRGQSSSGLGLALAKRLIEAQGGEISFSSEQGKGSTFTVTLPISNKGSSKSASLTIRRSSNSARQPSRRKTA
jgi:signal transduction histidine kinase